MIIRKIRLTEYEYQPPINFVAGATEPDIQFQLADYTIPAGATARCYVQRFDGTFEYTVASIDGNNVTVEPTSSMFSVRGEGAIQITLYAGEEVLKNFSVPVFVHADLADENAEQGSDVTGIFRAAEEQALEDFAEDAEAKAAEVIESIPEDYTELTEEVSELNERLDDVEDNVSSITQKTRNMFDDQSLIRAGISVGEDGYYYGTVRAWNTAFSSLFPVDGLFNDGERYTISCDYYLSDVETYTGNAMALKAFYTDDTSANLLSFSASNTTPYSASVTSSATKSLDHLATAVIDSRANNYVLHVRHLQIESGSLKTDYIPHIVVYDATIDEITRNIEKELSRTNAHIDDVAKNTTTFEWELGSVSSSGTFIISTTRIRTKSASKMLAGTEFVCDDGYQFRLFRYSGYVDPSMDASIVSSKYIDTSGWQTEPYTLENDGFYVVAFSTTNDTASVGIESHLTVSENVAVNNVLKLFPQYAKLTDISGFADEEKIESAVEAFAVNTVVAEWEIGIYNTGTGAHQASTTRVRTKRLIHLAKGTKVYVDANYMYRLWRYTKDDLTTFVEYYDYAYDSSLHWITGYFEIPATGYYGVGVSDYAGTTVSDATAVGAHLHILPSIALNNLTENVSLEIMPYNLDGLKDYIDAVNEMGGDVVLPIITDIHGGYPDTYDVINYLANSGIGNYMFELGDVIKSTFQTRSEAVAYLRESFHAMSYAQTNTPIIMLQGNHDTNPLSGTDTNKNVTQEIFYGLSMARTKNLRQPVNKTYGFVDIEEAKVRLIYLNTSDIYDKTTGNALVTGQYTMIQQDQIDWMIGTALNLSNKDTPTDWSVIILSHDSLSQVAGSTFSAVLSAFMDGSSAQGTQTVTVGTYSNVISYSCDFTSQGGIDVICEVNGHHHKDMIRELGTTGIKQVYVACEGPASASYDDDGATVYYDRARATTDEHLIDTLVLDKANRTVYFKRFGVGEDRSIVY